MSRYCITAANHKNANDDRASEFNVWEERTDPNTKKLVWHLVGKRLLNQVAKLFTDGHTVLSGKEVRNKEGKIEKLDLGAPIELELRIAKNDKNFKITDLPEF